MYRDKELEADIKSMMGDLAQIRSIMYDKPEEASELLKKANKSLASASVRITLMGMYQNMQKEGVLPADTVEEVSKSS